MEGIVRGDESVQLLVYCGHPFFGHSNIIRYTNRPFKSVGEMDYELIRRWNERVQKDDVVFHLGDFCFKETKDRNAKYYLDQLNGQKIFIAGNHDRNNSLRTCIQDIRIYLGGKHLLLIHNPNESTYGFDLVLAGHIHNRWLVKEYKFGKYRWHVFNVGVDANRFRPINIQEILIEYDKWRKGIINDKGEPIIGRVG